MTLRGEVADLSRRALDKVMDFRGWLNLCERNYVDGKPFLDSLDALKYIRDKHPRPQDLVVTFTQVDKVGINPQSPHSTPLEIGRAHV